MELTRYVKGAMACLHAPGDPGNPNMVAAQTHGLNRALIVTLLDVKVSPLPMHT